MNAHDLEEAIQEALLERDENHADLHGENPVYFRVVSYASAGILSRDAGLIVRTRSGDAFQVTIVQTRHGRDSEGVL
jgi:hypothetical protein